MKTVLIDYAIIDPMILTNKIERVFGCLTSWMDINEDYFEFSVYGCADLEMLEDAFAEYV